MTKEGVLQASFSAGELSPHLHDRVDLEAYGSGCAYTENFIPLPHGPLLRRRGSRFIYEAAGAAVRLLPFSFSVRQSFVLEFTHQKMRVFFGDGIVLGSGGSVLEVVTPYEAEDLPNLNWAQLGDWLYITDGRHTPRVVKRFANDDWRIEDLVFNNKPAEWVGDNQPKFIALFEQRAYYAGTRKQPQQVWGSRTGLYENFTMKDGETVLDDHAFTYTIFSNDTNGIEWLLPMGSLIVGTAGAEFKVSSTSLLDPITPKNIRISVQTHYGSTNVRPMRIGTSVVFIQRSRNRMRSFEYSFSEDQFTAQDLTIFASHILEGRVIEMQVQSAPDSYVWLVTERGELIGCTYEKNQKVLAWHRHTTDGKYKSICLLPGDGNDKLYAAVEREVNGQTRTYIELFEDTWEPTTDVMKAFYVDSGLVYEGAPVTTLVGLRHLEGREVQLLTDGWVHPPQTVVNGGITLQQPCKRVVVGLAYTSKFVSLIPQSQQRMSVGATRRIHEAVIALEDSADFKYCATNGRSDLAYNGPTRVMNKAIALESRHEQIVVSSQSEMTQQLAIWQDGPLPLVMRGIVYSIALGKI